MNQKEIAELVQSWLDDIQTQGIEKDCLPKKYRESDIDIDDFFDGMVFALELVIEELEK